MTKKLILARILFQHSNLTCFPTKEDKRRYFAYLLDTKKEYEKEKSRKFRKALRKIIRKKDN